MAKRGVYFNEIDPGAAQWLRELMKDGLISEGEVDERSIAEVQASDVAGFRQCHWFAGISGWCEALRLASWDDSREVWSGSCPCQPWSSAGSRKGNADARDLWPEFFRLIRECRPEVVFGEQVASADVVGTCDEAAFVAAIQAGDNRRANRLAAKITGAKSNRATPPDELTRRWVDGVHADLASEGYAVWFDVHGAHSVNSPHLRQRLYWVADTQGAATRAGDHLRPWQPDTRCGGGVDGLADAKRPQRWANGELHNEARGRQQEAVESRGGCIPRGVGNASGNNMGWVGGSPFGAEAEGDRGREVDGVGGVLPGSASGTCGVADTDSGDATEIQESDDAVREQRSSHGRGSEFVAGVGAGSGVGSGDCSARTLGGRHGVDPELPRDHAVADGVAQGDTVGNGSQGVVATGAASGSTLGAGGTGDGFWDDFAIVHCRDGKARRIPPVPQSGILGLVDGLSTGVDDVRVACEGRFPLARKVPNRTLLLKGYGNAICVPTAAAFVKAYLAAEAETQAG